MRLKAAKSLAVVLLSLGMSSGGLGGAQSASAATLSFANDSTSESLGSLTCEACSALTFSGALPSLGSGAFSWSSVAGEFFDLSSLPFFTGVSDFLSDLSAAADFANLNLGTNLCITGAMTNPGTDPLVSSADAVLLNLGGGSDPLFALLRNDAPDGGTFTFSWMGNSGLSTDAALASFTEINITDLPTSSPVSTGGAGSSGASSGSNTGSSGSEAVTSASISPVPLPLTGLLLLSGLGGLAAVRRKTI